MRRRIIMGFLALGTVVGFGSEIHRLRHGSCGRGCDSHEQAAPNSFSSTAPGKHDGGHCDGWKHGWGGWHQEENNQQAAPSSAPTAPTETTAANL